MKRRGLIAAAALVPMLSAGFSFVHPWGDVRGVPAGGEMLGGSAIPQDVRHTLESKCADCHSNRTHWPVYSRLAPGSWLMERDVHEGRAAMNLSAWNVMRTEDKVSALTRIAAEVRSGTMPTRPYAFMHPANRLTDSEQKSIAAWAKAERKQLRAMSNEQMRSNGQ